MNNIYYLAILVAAFAGCSPTPRAEQHSDNRDGGNQPNTNDGGGNPARPLDWQPDPSDAPNFIFVSRDMVVPGELQGAAGADRHCARAATAAGLTGRFVAWVLSEGAPVDALIRASRGWVRPDGLAVADQGADLLNGEMFYPVVTDEYGAMLPASADVVTGEPRAVPLDCGSWSDPLAQTFHGAIGWAGPKWLEGIRTQLGVMVSCSVPAHLLCVGIGRTKEVKVEVVPGRPMFVTVPRVFHGEDTLIGAATAACVEDALNAGLDLANDFKPVIWTATTNPRTTFAGPGPWVRTDGVVLLQSWDDVALGRGTAAPVVLNAFGDFVTRHPGTNACMTGLMNDEDPRGFASPEGSCSNWLSTDPTFEIGLGRTTSSFQTFSAYADSCQATQLLNFFCTR